MENSDIHTLGHLNMWNVSVQCLSPATNFRHIWQTHHVVSCLELQLKHFPLPFFDAKAHGSSYVNAVHQGRRGRRNQKKGSKDLTIFSNHTNIWKAVICDLQYLNSPCYQYVDISSPDNLAVHVVLLSGVTHGK